MVRVLTSLFQRRRRSVLVYACLLGCVLIYLLVISGHSLESVSQFVHKQRLGLPGRVSSWTSKSIPVPVGRRTLVNMTPVQIPWPRNFNCSYSSHHKQLAPLFKSGEPSFPKWMIHNGVRQTFFLVEVLQVRLYDSDKAKWTLRELKQWIHYMLWAGVEHIYLCDHYKFVHERLDVPLKRYTDLDLVTYIPWNVTGTAMQAQVSCYSTVQFKYGSLAKWMITVDMDEYPSVASDHSEGFLKRYLLRQNASTLVVHMHNFLMLGVGDNKQDMVMERLNRVTAHRANLLDKLIFQPAYALPGIHEVKLHGLTDDRRRVEVHGDESEIKSIHYWGGRLQNWGPDTPTIRNMTVEYNFLRDKVAPFVRISLLLFGECDSFNSTTGP